MIYLISLLLSANIQAAMPEACATENSELSAAVMAELELAESWQLWSQLDQFYKNNPLPSQDDLLQTTRDAVGLFKIQSEDRLQVAQLILKASVGRPDFSRFLIAYYTEMERGQMIINSQKIDKSNADWAKDRQALLQLLQQELEDKYAPTFQAGLATLDNLTEEEKTFLLDNFFAYYGKKHELPWIPEFEVLFRHIYDSFYSANLFAKVGQFGAYSYGIQPEVTVDDPELTMILAYRDQHKGQERRINLSYHLYPFATEKAPVLRFCDFSLTADPFHCEVMGVEQWCAKQN